MNFCSKHTRNLQLIVYVHFSMSELPSLFRRSYMEFAMEGVEDARSSDDDHLLNLVCLILVKCTEDKQVLFSLVDH